MFTGFWTDLFLILIAGDSFSTNLALNNGASEANKLYSFLSSELGAVLWVGKMVLGLGVILAIRKSKPEWLWVFRVKSSTCPISAGTIAEVLTKK